MSGMDSPVSVNSEHTDVDESFEIHSNLKRHKIISIEGNIGSGKSTLLANLKTILKDHPDVVFLKEPVDDWESIKDSEGRTMLQKFYANQEKYSFAFQMMAYISRLALLKETIKERPDAIIISERSLYTDKMVFAKMLHESGMIEDVNFQIYMKWFDNFAEDCALHKVVYVRTDPEICYSRIAKRSRSGEECIPLAYLEECHKYHEVMLDRTNKNCVCRDQLLMDGNMDIYASPENLQAMIDAVTGFINSTN